MPSDETFYAERIVSTEIRQPDGSFEWVIDNIIIGHRVSKFEGFGIQTASSDKNLVRLHFGIKGDYQFTYRQLNQSFDLVGGHHNLLYSRGISLEVENKSEIIETLGINFPPQVFVSLVGQLDAEMNAFIDKVVQEKPVIFSANWGAITPAIQTAIDGILLNPYRGRMEELFVLSKVLELMVLCFNNYRSKNASAIRFIKNKADRAKVIHARDYLNTHLDDPPSLAQVAREVGLNEFKLKHGFKETFGETLFAYLTKRRLNLAKLYLCNTDKSILEISQELGYSSPQHFHNQFKKHFGHTPNFVRNNP